MPHTLHDATTATPTATAVPPNASTPSVPNPLIVTLVPTPPTTIQEARGAGAVEGTMLTAPLAPASGPITVNVADVVPAKTTTAPDGTKTMTPAQEPLVVVTVKAFWQSPTVKALRNAVATAVGLAVLIVAVQLISVNGDLWAINWQTTQKAAIAAAAFSLASGYAAFWKRKDNNAVQK